MGQYNKAMRMFRRILGKLVAGLAILPSMRGATVAPTTQDRPPLHVETEDEILREMECTSFVSFRAEYLTRYTGPVTSVAEQSNVLAHAKNRRFLNACFGGMKETEEFIQARTRD